MWLWLPVAAATTLDDAQAACAAATLDAQPACWSALESAHPWAAERADWVLRELDLAVLHGDRQAERRARRGLVALRDGAWWVASGATLSPALATRVADEARVPVRDEPAWDPATLGVTLPAGVSGPAGWVTTADPAVWASAEAAFHGVYADEWTGAALVWEAWCAWQQGHTADALRLHSRAYDAVEVAEAPAHLRRELEDQALLFYTSTDRRTEAVAWAAAQTVDLEAAAAARLREQGAYAEAVQVWTHLVARAPMDARAPAWDFARVRDALDPAVQKSEVPVLVARYGDTSGWAAQQAADTRERVQHLVGGIFPYKAITFGGAGDVQVEPARHTP